MAGYGLSRIMQGTTQGLGNNLAHLERKDDRAREQLLFDQGQEDRQYQLERREVTDERADEQYELQREQQEFMLSADNAIREFAASNGASYQQLVDVYNSQYPDGSQVSVKRGDDGKFDMVFTKDGQVSAKHKGMSFDQVGQMAMSMRDPASWLNARKEAAVKAGDRAHDMAKIDREAEHKEKLEHIKGGYDLEGKRISEGGAVSKLSKEQRQIVSQGLSSLKSHYNSSDLENIINPSQRTEAMVANSLMERNVRKGSMDGQDAALNAIQSAGQLVAAANQQIEKEGLEGQEADDRRSQLILDFGVQLARRVDSEQQTATAGQSREQTPEYVDWLKAHDTPENRASFNKRFGQGAAEKALGGGKGVSLVREAKADEVKAGSTPAKIERTPPKKPEKKAGKKPSTINLGAPETKGIKPIIDAIDGWKTRRAVRPITDALGDGRKPNRKEVRAAAHSLKRLSIKVSDLPPEIRKYLEPKKFGKIKRGTGAAED